MGELAEQAVRRTIEETLAVYSSGREGSHLAASFARLCDLARSHSFLWVEMCLQSQERCSRSTRSDSQWSRTLVLATLAADIISGYFALRERGRWCPGSVSARDWELQHQRGANRLLDTAISLGGALIKACQFASTRPDLLPPAYIRSLSRLQDRLPPHAWPLIEETLRRELGQRPRDVFAWIEQEPIAAASIAQVHRARLHDGREVAVKVMYPEIAQLVRVDLAVLDSLAAAIARITPAFQLQPIVDYLRGTLPLELDFRREAAAATQLRAALSHRADVLVPRIYSELSSAHVLVMEFTAGIKITDRAALIRKGISPQKVARLLNDVYAEQMLRLGVLHADPHPGNLFVQPGPRLVLLDHGLTVPLAPPLVHALGDMVRALVNADLSALQRTLGEAGLQLDEADVPTLLQIAGVLLGEQKTGDTLEVGSRLGRSIGSIPIDLLLVGRALGVLDGITRQLAADVQTLDIVAGYVEA